MRSLITFVVVAGCGNDVGVQAVDAGVGGPPGSPMVTVMGPSLNESFYPTQTATVRWVATDDDSPSFTCDVATLAGTSMIPIAQDVATASGATTTAPWAIAGAAAGTYRVQVACTDANNLTGVGLSATFTVSAPPQDVSYAQVQELWNATCTGNACHDATAPAEGLNLTTGAYIRIVDQPSSQCPANDLVEPGAPERSYLVMKLQGSAIGCTLVGSKMPKPPSSISAAQIQLVRDWIFNGAPNN